MWSFVIWCATAIAVGFGAAKLGREIGTTSLTAWVLCAELAWALFFLKLITYPRRPDFDREKIGRIFVFLSLIFMGAGALWILLRP